MSLNRTVRPYGAIAHGPNPRQPLGVDVPGMSGGGAASTKSWSPTVANLLVLLVLELVAFATIRYLFHAVQK